MNRLKPVLAALLLAVTATASHAAEHAYAFTSTITTLGIGVGDVDGDGESDFIEHTSYEWLGHTFRVGDRITGTFVYDDVPRTPVAVWQGEDDYYTGVYRGNVTALRFSVQPAGFDFVAPYTTEGFQNGVLVGDTVTDADPTTDVAFFANRTDGVIFERSYLDLQGSLNPERSYQTIPTGLSLAEYPFANFSYSANNMAPDSPAFLFTGQIDSLTPVAVTSPVPEPASYLMMSAGLLLLGAAARRQKR